MCIVLRADSIYIYIYRERVGGFGWRFSGKVRWHNGGDSGGGGHNKELLINGTSPGE